MRIKNNKYKSSPTKRMVGRSRIEEETAFEGDENELSMATSCFSRKPLSDTVLIAQTAYLEIFGVKGRPFGYELGTKTSSIGRGPGCSIHLPLSGVSRLHARIFFQNEEYYIEDLNSTNGTYVNTVKIVKCVLRNNDQIDIGEAKIVFIEEKTRQALQ